MHGGRSLVQVSSLAQRDADTQTAPDEADVAVARAQVGEGGGF